MGYPEAINYKNSPLSLCLKFPNFNCYFIQPRCQGDDGNAKIGRGERDQEKTVPRPPYPPCGDDGQFFAKEC